MRFKAGDDGRRNGKTRHGYKQNSRYSRYASLKLVPTGRMKKVEHLLPRFTPELRASTSVVRSKRSPNRTAHTHKHRPTFKRGGGRADCCRMTGDGAAPHGAGACRGLNVQREPAPCPAEWVARAHGVEKGCDDDARSAASDAIRPRRAAVLLRLGRQNLRWACEGSPRSLGIAQRSACWTRGAPPAQRGRARGSCRAPSRCHRTVIGPVA
jgi:hypothetical protein